MGTAAPHGYPKYKPSTIDIGQIDGTLSFWNYYLPFFPSKASPTYMKIKMLNSSKTWGKNLPFYFLTTKLFA